MAIFNGTSGNDTLDGSLGSVNDALNGGLGDDLYRYNVGSGNDVITDTGGADTLQLGDPNNLHPSWNFYRSGANGKDLVIDFYGQGRITVINQFLGSPIVETLAFADEWESYPFANGVTGAAGNDLLVGTSMAETINGNAGDDLIFAGAGNDTILGGDGDDEIHDGLGNDSIVGGGGDDWIEVDGGSNIIDGGTGRDETSYINATQGVIVNLSGQVQGNLADGHVLKSIGVEDTLTSIESVYGSDFADVFFGGRTTGEGYFNAGQVEFIGGVATTPFMSVAA
jgi:Ca2+-binding RTX toxin-like protein